MTAEYINPFLQSATLVFKEILGLNLFRGKTAVLTNPLPERDIAILIGVKGSVQGEAVYSMNIETVYKICRKLMPGADEKTIQYEYRDVLGELANMMTGNALNIFMTKDTDLDVTVPHVVDVRNGGLRFKDQTTLALNLYSSYGILEIKIALSGTKPA